MESQEVPENNAPNHLLLRTKNRWYGPSFLRETESAVILSLPAARKIEWTEMTKGIISLIAVLGFLVIPFFFTPEYVLWGVLAALAVFIPTAFHWLYLFTGREELEIDNERIEVRYGIGVLKRSHKFQASAVEDLRCTATTYRQRTQPFGPGESIPSYVWVTKTDSRTSAVACEYNGQTISLFGWIEKPLSNRFLSRVKQRFPNYNEASEWTARRPCSIF